MILTADYHTHTKYSHGKGSVFDNALSAKQSGLSQIGITDHGFSHPAFGLRLSKTDKLIKDCKQAESETGVKVLVGIESNIVSVNGEVDLKPERYDKFDLFLAGIHKFIIYKFGSYFNFSIPNLFYSSFGIKNVPERLIKKTTQAYINVIKKNPIDVITHIGFCCFCDPVEVAKVAGDYGTYIELNAKKVHLSEEQLYKVSRTGARFVVNSDAHTPDRVGEISLVEKQLNNSDFPLDRIDNINGRLPFFRFAEFKEKKL